MNKVEVENAGGPPKHLFKISVARPPVAREQKIIESPCFNSNRAHHKQIGFPDDQIILILKSSEIWIQYHFRPLCYYSSRLITKALVSYSYYTYVSCIALNVLTKSNGSCTKCNFNICDKIVIMIIIADAAALKSVL